MRRRTRGRWLIVLGFLVAALGVYALSGEVRGWLVYTIHGR